MRHYKILEGNFQKQQQTLAVVATRNLIDFKICHEVIYIADLLSTSRGIATLTSIGSNSYAVSNAKSLLRYPVDTLLFYLAEHIESTLTRAGVLKDVRNVLYKDGEDGGKIATEQTLVFGVFFVSLDLVDECYV